MGNLYNALSQFFKGLPRYLTFDYLMLGAFGLLVLSLIISLIKTAFTYEVKLLRVVNGLNRYFLKEPYINEENLVRFNRKMKNVPRTLRYSWQEYMLNLDKAPSEYMSTLKCVDQPSRASGYKNIVKSTTAYTIIIAVLAFFASILIFNNPVSQGEANLLGITSLFFDFFLIPTLVLVLGLLFSIFMRARYSSIVSDLYFSFHEFERNINKACTTLPQFIDYEILFTKREIREGIPVLQEYLEKRALQEKLEQEEAELNAFGYEQFDFSEVGIENSLLLDRAMIESEKYFKVRNEITNRIKAKETEMQTYQKGYDEVTKDYERKAQALRETIQQLTEQINNTTIKIEANYMKRRQSEEQQKLQQLEKEYELSTFRFQKQQEEQTAEINAFKAEIERRKNLTHEAMLAEGRTYAKKVYTAISNEVQEQSRPYLEQMENTKFELENKVQNLTGELEFKSHELNLAETKLEEVKKEYQVKLAGIEHINVLKEFLVSPEFKAGLLSAEVGSEGVTSNVIELKESKEKVNLLTKELADKDNKIKNLETEKSAKEEELLVLVNNIKNQEKTVVRLTEEKQELEKAVTNLSDANTVLEKELIELEKTLKQSDKKDVKTEPVVMVKNTDSKTTETKDIEKAKDSPETKTEVESENKDVVKEEGATKPENKEGKSDADLKAEVNVQKERVKPEAKVLMDNQTKVKEEPKIKEEAKVEDKVVNKVEADKIDFKKHNHIADANKNANQKPKKQLNFNLPMDNKNKPLAEKPVAENKVAEDELKELKAEIEKESENLVKQQVELEQSIKQTIKDLNVVEDNSDKNTIKKPGLNKIGSALNDLLEVVETMEEKSKEENKTKVTANTNKDDKK